MSFPENKKENTKENRKDLNRETFLKTFWNRYPAAERDWIDVSAYDGKTGFVCGRLKLEGTWTLAANGRSIPIEFGKNTSWLPGQTGGFSERLLQSGDLICAHLQGRVADQVLLLAPAGPDYQLRSEFNTEIAVQLQMFMQEVRAFFTKRGFTETQTPTLVPSPGTEPYLEPFETKWNFGSETQNLFLPTSPEFHLKQLLAAGWTKIFEIKTCFRNGEVGNHHEPEFEMLEWYRAYSPLDAIADDVEALLSHLTLKLRPERPPLQLRRTSMAALFAEAFSGFQLTPSTTREELVDLALANGISVGVTDSWDDVFFRLFLEKIEGTLGLEEPVLVRGYPPAQAALSRIGNDGFADRFEVYWKGLELANAFHELNDPDENIARFEADRERKAEIGKGAVPTDENLIAALRYGLPPSGGIAMGLDRVFMALFEYRSIAETRAFPIARP